MLFRFVVSRNGATTPAWSEVVQSNSKLVFAFIPALAGVVVRATPTRPRSVPIAVAMAATPAVRRRRRDLSFKAHSFCWLGRRHASATRRTHQIETRATTPCWSLRRPLTGATTGSASRPPPPRLPCADGAMKNARPTPLPLAFRRGELLPRVSLNGRVRTCQQERPGISPFPGATRKRVIALNCVRPLPLRLSRASRACGYTPPRTLNVIRQPPDAAGPRRGGDQARCLRPSQFRRRQPETTVSGRSPDLYRRPAPSGRP